MACIPVQIPPVPMHWGTEVRTKCNRTPVTFGYTPRQVPDPRNGLPAPGPSVTEWLLVCHAARGQGGFCAPKASRLPRGLYSTPLKTDTSATQCSDHAAYGPFRHAATGLLRDVGGPRYGCDLARPDRGGA